MLTFARKNLTLPKHLAAGFTLIEILVVIVIIAIISATIVVQFGNYYLSRERSQVLAEEIFNLVNLAKSQAIFATSTIGLQISAKDYIFLLLDDKGNNNSQWKVMNQNDAFWKRHFIPNGTILNYKTANTTGIQGDSANLAPQIMFFPSGEMTPFTLLIHHLHNKTVYTITGTYTGHITLEKK